MNRKRERGNNAEHHSKHQRPKRKGKTTKQLEYATHRKTLIIIMGNGLRTLNIASLNPDSMRERETQQEIVKNHNKEQNLPSRNTGNAYNQRLQLHASQL